MFASSKIRSRPRTFTSFGGNDRAVQVERLEARALFSGGVLPYGVVSAGQIGTVGTQNVWTFDAHQNDQVMLALTSTAVQTGFSAKATLRTPAGETLRTLFAGGYSTYALPDDGTYTLTIQDSDNKQTGKYTLGLQGVNVANPNAKPLVKGGIVSGTIGQPLDLNEWVFDGVEGQMVKLVSTSTATQSGFSGRADLFAPSGAHVGTFYANSRQTYTLQESGKYLVTIHDSDDKQSGKYTIGFEGISPISPSPVKMNYGGITAGTIGSAIAVNQLTFSGKAGNMFALAMTSTAVQNGFSAEAEIYAPSGARVNGGTLFAGGQHIITLPENGTYMIEVHDSNYVETGKYTIGLESINPFSPNPGILAPGVARSAQNETGIDYDQYTFSARKGDVINFVLKSTAIEAGYSAESQVFDSSGSSLGTAFAGTRQFTIPASGTYMVAIHDSNFAERGKYSLTLNWNPGTATGGISGTLFNDANRNGKRESSEAGLSAWTMYIDANNNGKRDASDTTVRTDSSGAFAFYGLRAGTYVVRPVIASGYQRTAPKLAYYKVVLTKGQAFTTANFGAAKV